MFMLLSYRRLIAVFIFDFSDVDNMYQIFEEAKQMSNGFCQTNNKSSQKFNVQQSSQLSHRRSWHTQILKQTVE